MAREKIRFHFLQGKEGVFLNHFFLKLCFQKLSERCIFFAKMMGRQVQQDNSLAKLCGSKIFILRRAFSRVNHHKMHHFELSEHPVGFDQSLP